jgi:CheY-like chemotaxis protein
MAHDIPASHLNQKKSITFPKQGRIWLPQGRLPSLAGSKCCCIVKNAVNDPALPRARIKGSVIKTKGLTMKRRVLLVDDEVAVLLTLKAVLEINGFDVETAASAREGRMKLRNHEYHMVITDLRMESDQAGAEVIAAARTAPYHPAVALLTAFPLADEDWQEMGADHMLVKPMHTRILLEQIDKLMVSHTLKLENGSVQPRPQPTKPKKVTTAKKASGKGKPPSTTAKAGKRTPVKTAKKRSAKKSVAKKSASKKTIRKRA